MFECTKCVVTVAGVLDGVYIGAHGVIAIYIAWVRDVLQSEGNGTHGW